MNTEADEEAKIAVESFMINSLREVNETDKVHYGAIVNHVHFFS